VDEEHLPGNVGGAVRIGDTVHRPVGPWTPAVHALLRHLAGRLPQIPSVRGHDETGREVLDYLPGRVINTDTESLTPAQITSVARWTRAFHDAVAGFWHPGPWRYFALPAPTLIGHNDIAPYNACFDGDELAGVFDWDMSGPTTPVFELAFIAWNCVPLWRDIGAAEAARRLELIAAGYQGGIDARTILRSVPTRIQIMLDGIPAHAAAGDAGMANLVALGEPARSWIALHDLIGRIPAIDRALA
jgi:hypothetical protein